jgi:hypothetical protein
MRAAAGLLLLVASACSSKGAAQQGPRELGDTCSATASFSGVSFILDALSNAGRVRDLIVVYPSGRCCLTRPRYADAIDELAALVDQRYRTLAPADGPAFQKRS